MKCHKKTHYKKNKTKYNKTKYNKTKYNKTKKYKGGFDARILITPTKFCRELKEPVNCGPLSLYMMGIINYNELNTLNKELAQSFFGMHPKNILEILSNKDIDSEWYEINMGLQTVGLQTVGLQTVGLQTVGLQTYFENLEFPGNEYITLILGVNIDEKGRYRSGHYSVVHYNETNRKIQIANPHSDYDRFSTLWSAICNRGSPSIKYTPIEDFVPNYNRIFILKEISIGLKPNDDGMYKPSDVDILKECDVRKHVEERRNTPSMYAESTDACILNPHKSPILSEPILSAVPLIKRSSRRTNKKYTSAAIRNLLTGSRVV